MAGLSHNQQSDSQPPPSPRVFIVTQCRDMNLLYGSTLVFGSIRKGFPTADITVVDNASLEEARVEIEALASGVSAEFMRQDEAKPYADLIGALITDSPGTAVLVDPDVCFWEEVEGWDFTGSLVAGRLIPEFHDPFTGCISAARLHTSFLWVPDTQRLLEAVAYAQQLRPDYYPLTAFSYPDVEGRVWRHFDTGAALYAAFQPHTYTFGELELSAYDHLFAGTGLPAAASRLPEALAELWVGAHKAAKLGELEPLRGMYKGQQQFFDSRRVS